MDEDGGGLDLPGAKVQVCRAQAKLVLLVVVRDTVRRRQHPVRGNDGCPAATHVGQPGELKVV